jgi:hypothetical protein
MILKGRRCPICGQVMTTPAGRGTGPGGKGRPAKYDTPACREIAAIIGQPLETRELRARMIKGEVVEDEVTAWMGGTLGPLVKEVTDRAVPEAKLMIRRRIMQIGNSFAWNKGVANLAVKRSRGQASPETPEQVLNRAWRKVRNKKRDMNLAYGKIERAQEYIRAHRRSAPPASIEARGRIIEQNQILVERLRGELAELEKALVEIRFRMSESGPTRSW